MDQEQVVDVERAEMPMIEGRNGGKLKPAVNSEQGRDLARRRWDTAERLARKAIAQEAGVDNWGAGLFSIVKAQTALALTGTRGSTPAANFVFKAARLLREPERAENSLNVGVAVVVGDAAAASIVAQLAEIMSRRAQSE